MIGCTDTVTVASDGASGAARISCTAATAAGWSSRLP